MDKLELEIQKEGARAYDALFVPALFGQWAEIVANASNVNAGDNALDVACGTGVLTRKISERVTPEGSVTGLDPNVGMLSVAAEYDSTIQWKEGVAESLPFESDIFDSVVCQFGLMFFDNPALSIQECMRVARPSGTLVFAVWDSIENIPGYRAEHSLISRLAGSDAAQAVAAPFNMGDINELNALLVSAGAANVAIETHRGIARFPDIATMVNAELRGWLPIMGVHLEETLIQTILAEAERELSEFRVDGNKMEFEITAHVAVVTT